MLLALPWLHVNRKFSIHIGHKFNIAGRTPWLRVVFIAGMLTLVKWGMILGGMQYRQRQELLEGTAERLETVL